jgi:hypothetical protein
MPIVGTLPKAPARATFLPCALRYRWAACRLQRYELLCGSGRTLVPVAGISKVTWAPRVYHTHREAVVRMGSIIMVGDCVAAQVLS